MKSDSFFGDDNSDDTIKDANEDRAFNDIMIQALEMAATGANIEDLIASLPPHLQEKVRKRTQKSSGKAKTGLRSMVGLMAKQAYDKIVSTMMAKPDFQRKVQEAGRVLMRNGVIVDTVRISEADLGNLPPMVGVAKDKDKTQQR